MRVYNNEKYNKSIEFPPPPYSHKGFTLAETLITLVIIGVIAAITLPSLIAKINDIQFIRARERILLTVGEAGRLIAIEGNMNSGSDTEDFVKNILNKKLNIIKFCGTSSIKCGFSNTITQLDENTTITMPRNIGELGGGTTWFTEGDTKSRTSYAFVTANGYSVNLYYNPKCRILSNTENDRMANDSICMNAVYDINGIKKPNKVGKDIGWVSIIGNNASVVAVAPMFEPTTTFGRDNLLNARNRCAESGLTLPNLSELQSASFNRRLLNSYTQDSGFWSDSGVQDTTSTYWTINPYRGIKNKFVNTSNLNFRCVKH